MNKCCYIHHWTEISLSSKDNKDLEDQLILAYKKTSINYPKYYKMNSLCKLAWLALNRCLGINDDLKHYKGSDDIGTLFCNNSSSLVSDLPHAQVLNQKGGDVASPSVFVYTLPNIVNGEMAIYMKWHGYNEFLIIHEQSSTQFYNHVHLLFETTSIDQLLIGYVEVGNGTGLIEARMCLLDRNSVDGTMWSEEVAKRLILSSNK
ncbi:MAG TPA: hypothetical protein PK076_04340 [Saprospiraceae bacterium]|nr:hypothetical protein [Saprospiraceae bacterium]